MNFTPDEVNAAISAAMSDADTKGHRFCLSTDAARILMARGAALLAARGGTMTAEDIAGFAAWAAPYDGEPMAVKGGCHPAGVRRLLQHIAAQGAEVARYQARVAELVKERDAAKDAMLSEGSKFLSEVQRADRLDAEVATLREKVAALEAAQDRTRQFLLDKEDEVKALRAELARLQPSGQVAELVKWAKSGDTVQLRQAGIDGLAALAQVNGGSSKAEPVEGAPWRCAAGTCGHDDAATPGHAGRVKAGSEEFKEAAGLLMATCGDYGGDLREEHESTTCPHDEKGGPCDECDTPADGAPDSYERGAESMRAACREAVQAELERLGYGDSRDRMNRRIKGAIEGAAP